MKNMNFCQNHPCDKLGVRVKGSALSMDSLRQPPTQIMNEKQEDTSYV